VENRDASILTEAHKLVTGDRHEEYGGWREDYQAVADFFRLLSGVKLSPEQCLKFMLAVKLSRESRKHKRDNLVDLCGYAEGLNRLEEGAE